MQADPALEYAQAQQILCVRQCLENQAAILAVVKATHTLSPQQCDSPLVLQRTVERTSFSKGKALQSARVLHLPRRR